MFNKFFIAIVALFIAVIGLGSATNLFASAKIHDPAKKAQVAEQIKFLEKEYTEAATLRQSVRNKTGDFKDTDDATYDEFVNLVEADFQNTSDQLNQSRRVYSRFE